MHRSNDIRNNARVAAFLISIVTGISIWALSNFFTGYREPWDSPSVYYSVSIALFSFVIGLIFPRHSIFITTGMIFGQSAYMLIALPTGPLWPVGLLTLIFYTAILGLPLSWLGTKLRMLILVGPEKPLTPGGGIGHPAIFSGICGVPKQDAKEPASSRGSGSRRRQPTAG